MFIHDFTTTNSILQKYIAELRSVTIQKDALRFRKNIERIGQVLGYELSKLLSYYKDDINTPYGIKKMFLPKEDVVVCAILRAGLPLHQGVLHCFDNAENAFISAYRKHDDSGKISTIVEYLASPDLTNKTLILCDPMLATGSTLVTVYEVLKERFKLGQIHIVSVIGAAAGIERVRYHFPDDTHLWITAIDTTLSSDKYIYPGLGDAGDLSYGIKL